MSEASNLWYERVDKAVQDLNRALEDHRRFLLDQATLRTELRLALFKAQAATRPAVTSAANTNARKKPLRAAAAALVLGSASYAQAYDYVDARGYRHRCHHENCTARKDRAADENDLSWEPPPGVKWQAVHEPEKSARAD